MKVRVVITANSSIITDEVYDMDDAINLVILFPDDVRVLKETGTFDAYGGKNTGDPRKGGKHISMEYHLTVVE